MSKKISVLLGVILLVASLGASSAKADVICSGLSVVSGGCHEFNLPFIELGEWSIGNSAYYIWPHPAPWNPPGQTGNSGWLEMYHVATGVRSYARVISAVAEGELPGDDIPWNYGYWTWSARVNWGGNLFDIDLILMDVADMDDYFETCAEGVSYSYSDCDVNE